MNRNKGSIFILVIIFSIILSITGMIFISMAGTERIMVQTEVNRSRALYLAEAGVDRAAKWLTDLSQVPTTIIPFDPFVDEEVGGVVILENGTPSTRGSYVVSIDPDDSNPGKIEKNFIITSTGIAGNIEKSLIYNVNVINLATFAYFSDKEVEDGAVGKNWDERIYFTSADIFHGPVHSNDEISICGVPSFTTYNKPPYGNTYQITTSKDFYFFNDKNNRAGGAIGSPLNLPFGQYDEIPEINLYKDWNLDRLKKVAMTSSDGLYVNNNSKILIEIGENKIECDDDDWNVPASGGLVFCKGDVDVRSKPDGSGFKCFQRKLTIVSSGTINIIGSIIYHSTIKGMIGLVSGKDIVVSSTVPIGQFTLQIDSVIMAYGSFLAEDWNSRLYDPPQEGIIKINGGIIQGIRQPVGVAPASVGSSVLITGYKKDFNYDDRVINSPPPYFPISAKISPITWKEGTYKFN